MFYRNVPVLHSEKCSGNPGFPDLDIYRNKTLVMIIYVNDTLQVTIVQARQNIFCTARLGLPVIA